MQLQTAHEVNRHLNGEVEDLVLRVDALQQENEARMPTFSRITHSGLHVCTSFQAVSAYRVTLWGRHASSWNV